jgi:hypothetical protein
MNNEIPPAPNAGSTQVQDVTLSQEWMDRLAQHAKETQAAEKLASNFFSTKSGVLSFNGMAIPNNTMECIALVSMHENVWYDAKFDANNLSSPGCYAFSFTGENMVPHPEAEHIQAPTCGQCPKLKWGTSDNGKGKACRETRRISLLPASAAASPEAVAAAVAGLLRVPITSVKHWAAYVARLATLNLPPFAMLTEVKLVPDAKSMFRLEFAARRPINNPAVLEALTRRIEVEKNNMIAPYPRRDPTANPAPQGQQAVAQQSAFAPPQQGQVPQQPKF